MKAAAALAAALLIPWSAASAADALEPAFSNTIVSTYPDGRQVKLWLDRDGTYRAEGRTGRSYSGRWTMRGERICLKQRKPFPAPFSYCTNIREGGVGTSWTGKAVTGEPVRISVVAGR